MLKAANQIKHPKNRIWQFSYLLLILAYGFCPSSFASLPVNNAIPGGIAVIPLLNLSDHPPKVRFGQKNVFVAAKDSIWFALVGLPHNIIPGKYLITVEPDGESQYKRSFRVHALPASEEHRTIILPKKLKSLSIKTLKDSELENILSFSSKSNSLNNIDFDFKQAILTGSYVPFGKVLRSKDSDQLLDHPWITYITKPLEIVRSPGKGIVEQIYITENSGLSVVINHNNGLQSILKHIDQTILKTGDDINAGDPVGTAKSLEIKETGRTDWFLIMNGTLIDPLQFTSSS